MDRIEKDYLKRKESTSQQPHESTQCQSPQNTQYYTPPTEAADGNVEQTEEVHYIWISNILLKFMQIITKNYYIYH